MSVTNLEREIRHLLNRGAAPHVVADELIQRWRMNLFNEKEQQILAGFLVASGNERLLLGEVDRLLKDNRKLPWTHFVTALLSGGIEFSEKDLSQLKAALRFQDALNEFVSWPKAATLDAEFAELGEVWKISSADQLLDQKAALVDQLQFFRNQRMHEEEAAALKKLQALFPDDSAFRLSEEDLAERWARDVLHNFSSRSGTLTEEIFERAQALQPEFKTAREIVTKDALAIAKQNANVAYDLALMFLFMEAYNNALEVLEHSPPSERSDWLRLELLIKARQFAFALEEANRLESLYASNPESTFTATYARARALWGLGQSQDAIELMRSIVNVRPTYKSARTLLTDWAGDA